MEGRTCLVTGGSSGIGRATCVALAGMGARVLLTSRALGRAEEAAAAIAGEVRALALDLASMDDVVRFAAELDEPLDVVVHNAGVVHPSRTLTVDGFESQMAVTYLGPWLLTERLRDRVRPGGRIVNVASDLHRGVTLDLEDLHSASGYQFVTAFGRAELAKLLWTYELARRWPEVTVNALHPGGVRTQLFREFRGPMRWLLWLSNLLKASPARGARTSVYLASSAEVAGETGGYYVRCRRRSSSKASQDAARAAALWARTVEVLSSWV